MVVERAAVVDQHAVAHHHPARALRGHLRIVGDDHQGSAGFAVQRLEQGLTVVMVTHEADIAAHAGRVIGFIDGKIGSDKLNLEAA